jgi:hypothetical protein
MALFNTKLSAPENFWKINNLFMAQFHDIVHIIKHQQQWFVT